MLGQKIWSSDTLRSFIIRYECGVGSVSKSCKWNAEDNRCIIVTVSIMQHSKKVKCTLVQALRLCTGRAAHRASRGIALLFLYHGTRRGWGVSAMPRPLFTPGKDPVPIVQEAGWAPRLVWTGAENLAPTGIWSPDCPAHSQSLYWLHYPAHLQHSM